MIPVFEMASQTTQSAQTVNLFANIPRKPIDRKPIARGVYENSRLCKVYDLDLSDPLIAKIPRAGLVYCTNYNGEVLFCFGRDKDSRDLTDFGGTRRRNESPIDCAVREGNEESRFVFGKLDSTKIQNFWCLYNSQMLIVFVPVEAMSGEDIVYNTIERFQSGQLIPKEYIRTKDGLIVISHCCDEISEIVWLNETMLFGILSEYSTTKVYARVRRFIRSCPEFRLSFGGIGNWLLH